MDLTQLTPEQLASLKGQLDALTPTDGRSAFRPRQLHDLRLAPTATDARPMFVWSAETPRDFVPTPTKFYPSLIWHQVTGEERTIHSAEERMALGQSWASIPPQVASVDPEQDMRDALEALSDEDRALLLEAQRQDRMAVLQKKLAGLTQDQLDTLLAGTATPEAKRGPGRPKKAAVA